MWICGRKCGICTLLFLGAVLATLGLVMALCWYIFYDKLLLKELVLTNTSRSYGLWKETPIPMYLSVYVFNWTNANEVLNSKWAVKPEFQECGPYVFSEKHIRVNLKWNVNGTVTYQQKRIWHFLPSKSNGSLSDRITNLNPIVTVVGNKVRDRNFLVRKAAELALSLYEKRLIMNKTVDELLFTGYEDELLKIISKLKVLNIPFTKFGWFYSRNESATYDGTFTIYTGETGIELLGMLDLWNGASFTNDYNSYCALINGTSGELWPPVTRYNQVSIFSPDICSSVAIQYREDAIINGVSGRKYVGTDYAFNNGSKYPEQACYQGDRVVPSGTRDISKCKFDAPAFISYPHFYLADDSYRNAIKGMRPNKTLHEMYMTLEPKTGIPLDARAQLQLNLYVDSIPAISLFANIKPTYIPMIWFRQEATLTEDYCSMVRVLLNLSHIGTYVGWSAFGIGAMLVTLGVLLLSRTNWNDNEEEHLLADEQQ